MFDHAKPKPNFLVFEDNETVIFTPASNFPVAYWKQQCRPFYLWGMSGCPGYLDSLDTWVNPSTRTSPEISLYQPQNLGSSPPPTSRTYYRCANLENDFQLNSW
uniref:Uncharacterized protein n=1 Tax=Romanomermis culicivorax TaxID=13658 RepID=A0A915KX39_ROMCU